MAKVLVVVDMQNDFIDGTLGSNQAKAIVPNVVEKIKNFDGAIFVTQDSHLDKNYLNTQEGKNLPIKHCIMNTEGWQINKDVKDALPENTTYITKFTFGSIELMKIINNYDQNLGWNYGHGKTNINDKVDEIEFCGLCTDICVLNNAILAKTWFPDVKIIVDSKCCAGVTEETHNAALTAMKANQIEVI